MNINIDGEKSINYKCPFCGREHTAPSLLNVICECGAKYYYNTKKWLNRNTGEWKNDRK